MKRYVSCSVIFIVAAGLLFSDPVDLSVKLSQLLKIDLVSERNLVVLDDGPGSRPINPWFEGTRGISFPLNDNTIIILDATTAKTYQKGINSTDYENPLSRWANDHLSVTNQLTAVSVLRIGYDYITSYLIDLPNNFVPYTLFDNLILLGNNRGTHCLYASILVESDGTWKEMNHEQTLEYLLAKGSDFVYDGDYLFYMNNVLRGSRDIIDDDGNQYSGNSIMILSKNTFTMETPEGLNISSTMFDPEGNFWAVAYTADEKQNPILYYAGRDWGYREPPKKAVTTDSGLRIRLRASTDAFVLGSLGKGEAITILKTGETATIGGITAPWYRIKKADGLIGWAFGGFIRVLE